MNKKLLNAEIRVKDIINQLRPYGFDRVLDDPKIAENWFYSNEKELPDNIGWADGATRMVIWDIDYEDFVIKFDKCDQCELSYADSYTGNEARVYTEAIKCGLEHRFAWIDRIGFFGNTEIFAMEYYYCDECAISDASYQNRYLNFCKENDYDPDDEDVSEEFYYNSGDCTNQEAMFELMEEIWGPEEEWEVERFLRDMQVTDIHSGNIAYNNGEIVIVDYASF